MNSDKINCALNKALRNLVDALEDIDRISNIVKSIYKRPFFTVLNIVGALLLKFKILPNKNFLVINFRYLFDIFQTIKHESHIILLQPRLQAINSIEA